MLKIYLRMHYFNRIRLLDVVLGLLLLFFGEYLYFNEYAPHLVNEKNGKNL